MIVCVGKASGQAREFIEMLHKAGFVTTGDIQRVYDDYQVKHLVKYLQRKRRKFRRLSF